jgi:hypothetical protein
VSGREFGAGSLRAFAESWVSGMQAHLGVRSYPKYKRLITRDSEGKPFTVRYEAVNAMLLNEFLKEHRKVQRLEATVAQQQTQIKALVSGLQNVSAQLEMSKPAPQVVANNQ